MLNRRSLRIKVMQSLFSLQQCKDANYELCFEQINEAFMPDLNSMEAQDKPMLAAKKKEASQLFETTFAKGETTVEHPDKVINKVVNECFKFYITQSRKDTDF